MNTIHVEKKNFICTLSLTRSEVRNAFNAEMIEELTKVFKELQKDEDTRVVILKGSGESFCAGADLTWMKSNVGMNKNDNVKDSQKLYDMFSEMEKIPIPIIGQIHGHAMGGGMGLVALCDIVAAVEGTKFCFSEVRLGIAPAVISTFVAKKISRTQLHRWFLTAEIFESKKAFEIGFIHTFGDESFVAEFVDKIASKLCKNGPQAVRASKALIHNIYSSVNPEKESVELIAKLRVSAEGQEGLQAFLDKRKPSWINE